MLSPETMGTAVSKVPELTPAIAGIVKIMSAARSKDIVFNTLLFIFLHLSVLVPTPNVLWDQYVLFIM